MSKSVIAYQYDAHGRRMRYVEVWLNQSSDGSGALVITNLDNHGKRGRSTNISLTADQIAELVQVRPAGIDLDGEPSGYGDGLRAPFDER